MIFEATYATWDEQCRHYGRELDPKEVYTVHVEPLTGKVGAFRLWHKYRDRYAERLGPRNLEECKTLLKLRYGPQFEAGRVHRLSNGEQHFVWDSGMRPPEREGRFVTLPDEGRMIFLVSMKAYSKDELLTSMQGIKDELGANGVDISDLEGQEIWLL